MIIPIENFAHLYDTLEHVRIVWPLCEEQKNRRTSLWPPYSLRPMLMARILIFAEPMNKTKNAQIAIAALVGTRQTLCFPDELSKPLGHW
jgi:hypothetical protein